MASSQLTLSQAHLEGGAGSNWFAYNVWQLRAGERGGLRCSCDRSADGIRHRSKGFASSPTKLYRPWRDLRSVHDEWGRAARIRNGERGRAADLRGARGG